MNITSHMACFRVKECQTRELTFKKNGADNHTLNFYAFMLRTIEASLSYRNTFHSSSDQNPNILIFLISIFPIPKQINRLFAGFIHFSQCHLLSMFLTLWNYIFLRHFHSAGRSVLFFLSSFCSLSTFSVSAVMSACSYCWFYNKLRCPSSNRLDSRWYSRQNIDSKISFRQQMTMVRTHLFKLRVQSFPKDLDTWANMHTFKKLDFQQRFIEY